MTDNMEIWNKVCTTNPEYTKKMTHGAKLTAVCAMYQIQTATEIFGAAGKGWGWSYSDPIFPPNGTVVIKCTVWHGSRENIIEQFGQKNLSFGSKPDEDAFKKAATDGLTKCLSGLGFNADVFLGKFDDNKYVKKMEEEHTTANPEIEKLYQAHITKLCDQKDGAEFKMWWSDPETKADRERLKLLSRDKYKELVKAMKIKSEELKPKDDITKATNRVRGE